MGVLNTDIDTVVPWGAYKLQIIEHTVAHYVHQEQHYSETGIKLGKPEMHTLCNQNVHWSDILSTADDLIEYIRDVIYDLCGRPCIVQKVAEGRWCAIPSNPVHRYDNEIVYSFEITLVAKQHQQE